MAEAHGAEHGSGQHRIMRHRRARAERSERNQDRSSEPNSRRSASGKPRSQGAFRGARRDGSASSGERWCGHAFPGETGGRRARSRRPRGKGAHSRERRGSRVSSGGLRGWRVFSSDSCVRPGPCDRSEPRHESERPKEPRLRQESRRFEPSGAPCACSGRETGRGHRNPAEWSDRRGASAKSARLEQCTGPGSHTRLALCPARKSHGGPESRDRAACPCDPCTRRAFPGEDHPAGLVSAWSRAVKIGVYPVFIRSALYWRS